MKSLSDIGKLVLVLAIGASFARCGDDRACYTFGTKKIGDKYFNFWEESDRVSHNLIITSLDSTREVHFFDANNNRMLDCYGDKVQITNPRENLVLKTVLYEDPEFTIYADSMAKYMEVIYARARK
jgi:hypothetical protein